jgi:hypothetical protein
MNDCDLHVLGPSNDPLLAVLGDDAAHCQSATEVEDNFQTCRIFCADSSCISPYSIVSQLIRVDKGAVPKQAKTLPFLGSKSCGSLILSKGGRLIVADSPEPNTVTLLHLCRESLKH